jgi:hypothetical protein
MRLKRLLVAAPVILSACKPPTPAEQLDSALSWVATARMAGEAWLRHTTPDKYTRETLELSQQTLLQLGTKLLKSPVPGVDSAALDSVFTRSRGHIAQMAALVTAKNSPGFRQQMDSLTADETLVKQFADSADSRQ